MKLVLSLCALAAVVPIAAPAQPLLLQFHRCDAILIEDLDGQRITGKWLHGECLNNAPVRGLIAPGLIANACPGGNGNPIIACLADQGCPGGDRFWVLDSLDGTLDENAGSPFGEYFCLNDQLG